MQRRVRFLSTIFLTLFVSLSLLSIFSLTTYATDSPDSSIPAPTDISTKIDQLSSLEHYTDYRTLDAATLQETTPFYREYQYLYRLTDTAEFFIAHYDTTSPQDLRDIVAALDDAFTACSLRFATLTPSDTSDQPSIEPAPTNDTPVTTSSVDSNPAPTATTTQSTAPRASSAPSTPATVATSTTTDTNTSTDNPTTESTEAEDQSPIEVPLTSTPESDSNDPKLPLSMRITLAITAVSAIAALIVVCLVRTSTHHPANRRPQHPNRKF